MNLRKWDKFLVELANFCFFWLFGVLFFTLFRLVFILFFRKQITETPDAIELFKVFFLGFRFDCTAVSYFLILPLASLLILSLFNQFTIIKVIRKIHQVLFVILSSTICVVTINYFKEYNNQFNNFLFVGLYDDQKAVLDSIIKDFHPIINGVILVLLILSSFLVLSRFEEKRRLYSFLNRLSFKGHEILLVIITIGLFVGSLRGSFGEIPVIRKYTAISKDLFLNKIIINPYRSLKYAIDDFKELNLLNDVNPFLQEEELKGILKGQSIDSLLYKKAKGPRIDKPKQLFLVVMESYDSWPLLNKYKDLGVATELTSIAERGKHFTNFLPASHSTFNSYASIVGNVPYTGVNINSIGSVNQSFKSSMFTQFKKLGYKINVFYGGFLTWQNIGDFSDFMGADKVYSGAYTDENITTGEWGIKDDKLFDLVLDKVNTEEYTLNIILTLSYHTPFAVDIYKEGFPIKKKKDLPEATKLYFKNTMNLKQLGHLWYSDKAIGDFVREAEGKFTNSLFCFTGDHFGRRFVNHKPNLYEKSSVPFIMYGKSIEPSKEKTLGSHIDIMPTLIEMIAPQDFEYYSFGESLLDKSVGVAIGHEKIMYNDDIFYFPKNGLVEKGKIKGKGVPSINESFAKKKHDSLIGIAWQYIMKENRVKD
ncbi:LTA synthase family protein [Pseudofulvibacter geojedonensis]|uniref:LTA synthase family protein n=1 Tax=Pseudofulvibacter geojedonensis TaxID=1123758 RepID=A0ABW3HZW0_9FLAO